MLTGIFAIALTACQATDDSQSGANQNNSTADANQTTVTEDLMAIKSKRGLAKESSPNAANAPYDLQFLDTMIEHQQSAVEIAKPIVAKADNAELKKFAVKIVADQNKNVEQMKNWRKKWFASQPAAMNMEMPGIAEATKGINLKKMDTEGGKQLDMRFLDMMTKHHQGAITLANEALEKAEHREIKTLANQIIKAREAEIKRMQDWKTSWSQ